MFLWFLNLFSVYEFFVRYPHVHRRRKMIRTNTLTSVVDFRVIHEEGIAHFRFTWQELDFNRVTKDTVIKLISFHRFSVFGDGEQTAVWGQLRETQENILARCSRDLPSTVDVLWFYSRVTRIEDFVQESSLDGDWRIFTGAVPFYNSWHEADTCCLLEAQIIMYARINCISCTVCNTKLHMCLTSQENMKKEAWESQESKEY